MPERFCRALDRLLVAGDHHVGVDRPWQIGRLVAGSHSTGCGTQKSCRGDHCHAHAIRLLRLALLLPASLWFGTLGPGRGARPARRIWPCPRRRRRRRCALVALVRSRVLARRQGAGRGRRGDHRASDRAIVLDVSPPALRSLTIDGKLSFANDRDLALTTEWIYLPGGELDIGSEAAALHAQGDDHPDRQRQGRKHQHHGRPRHHAAERHAEPARRPRQQHLDQARRTPPRPAAARIEVLNAAGWRKGDVIVLASTDFNPRQAEERTDHRRQRQRAHPRQAAAVHALRRDHLRRRRARRSRPADPQHQDPGVGRRGEDLLRRPHHGDGRLEDVSSRASSSTAWARTCTWPATRSTGTSLGDGPGPVHRELVDPRHLQPLRDGARHQRPAGREQRDLQHRRPLLLPRRRHRARQPVHPQPRHPDQVPSDTGLRADQPRRQRRARHPIKDRAAIRQASFSGKDTLLPSDNTAATFWITNPDNSFIDNVAAGSDENGFWLSLPEHPQGAFMDTDSQQDHLAAPNAAARVQGQRRPLQLRRVHVRPEHQSETTPSACPAARYIAVGKSRRPEQRDGGDALRRT